MPRAEPPPAALAAGAFLVGLAALTAASIGWASDDGAAFADAVRILFYVGLFTLVVAATARGEVAPWLHGLAIGLTGIAALALLSRYQPGLLGDADIEIARAVPGASGRLSYPIGYWNGLGAAMAIAIALLVWIGARGHTRLVRTLATAALPVPLLALYLTTSRGGAIAAAVAVAVLLGLGPARMRLAGTALIGGAGGLALVGLAALRPELVDRPAAALAAGQGDEMTLLTPLVVIATGALRHVLDPALERLRPPRRVPIAVLGATGVIALVAVVAADPVEQWESFKSPPAEAQNFGAADASRVTSSGRYQFWGAAIDAFEAEPLRGIGSGGYEAFWAQNGSIAATARNAHSLFFETLAELGPAGLLCALGTFAVAAVAGWRRLRMLGGPPGGEVAAGLAILAAGAVSVGIDWSYDLPLVMGSAIVAAALLAGPATLPRLAPRVEPPAALTRSRPRMIAGICVLVLALAAVCASGVHFLAERSLGASESALADGRPGEAIDSAADAIDLEPWAAEPRLRLAVAYEDAGDLAAAQAALAAAIERAPEDWRNWALAVRLEVAANDLAGARIAFRRARELNPRNARLRRSAEALIEAFAGG